MTPCRAIAMGGLDWSHSDFDVSKGRTDSRAEIHIFDPLGIKELGGTNPHLNLAYDYRKSEFELGERVEGLQFPGLTPIGVYTGADDNQYATQYVTPSNVPSRANDNVLTSALGLKYTPRPNITLLANVIFPLNDGGLRSSWIPTVGFSYSL